MIKIITCENTIIKAIPKSRTGVGVVFVCFYRLFLSLVDYLIIVSI